MSELDVDEHLVSSIMKGMSAGLASAMYRGANNSRRRHQDAVRHEHRLQAITWLPAMVHYGISITLIAQNCKQTMHKTQEEVQKHM